MTLILEGISPREIKECRNHACSRKDIPVWAPGRKQCTICGTKLKGMSWRSKNNLDCLMIELLDINQIHERRKGDSTMMGYYYGDDELVSEDVLEHVTSPLNTPSAPYHAVAFADFSGDVTAYQSYIKEQAKQHPDLAKYLSFNDWAAIEVREGRKDKSNWEDYVDWIITLGIQPPSSFDPATRKWRPYSETGPRWRGGKIVPFRSKDKDADKTFTCEADIAGCPIVSKTKPIIHIPNPMFDTWVYLAKCFDSEWIAYLIGSKQDDGSYLLTDMYYPKQVATSAHVEAAEREVREGVIGSVHSHVGMSAFFSAEDEKHLNHEVEIIINRKGEFAAKTRVKLECGRYSRIEASGILIGSESQEAAVADLKSKLTIEKGGYNK